jgi:hypothetical protein
MDPAYVVAEHSASGSIDHGAYRVTALAYREDCYVDSKLRRETSLDDPPLSALSGARRLKACLT